ncbi:S9 family peptidase [Desulfonatronum sp. SC1]|uniref:S9 family peptidase n=1 Tax=Desulfonatronum sp. SC1 TaxID=2109626 RepID=UPI001304F697|nr:S9 family peptidase [Desulfonatronum sp. SC1]
MAANLLTPEALWEIGRVSDPRISPDGSQVLFSVKHYNLEDNVGRSHLYVTDMDGSNRRRISPEDGNDGHGEWRPDGNRIGFLHQGQIWEMNPDGSGRRRLTDIPAEVTGFRYSPTRENILFSSPVPSKAGHDDLFAGLDKAHARIVNELMYRHWDTWIESFSHLHLAAYSDAGLGEHVDIMRGLGLESPFRPFGGMEQASWSPDGRSVAYSARSTDGKAYALSTNSRIMLYSLDTGQTRTLSTGVGYDVNPEFSPDGKRIAWLSMERNGYEADKNRLLVLDLFSETIADLTTGFDQDVEDFSWSTDSAAIFFTSLRHASTQIYRLDLSSREIVPLTEGKQTFSQLVSADNAIVAVKSTLSRPGEVFRLDTTNQELADISRVNDDFPSSFVLGEVRERWVKTADNRKMLVLVVLPPDFDPQKTYPAKLYCIGGPEVSVDHSWSYRWNLQTLAARGYVVVGPNRRGTPGFGQQWKEAVLGDWGGLPMQDLLAAIDDVATEPWVDSNRLVAVGPSFGGYSVYWLAGNHDNRFKALVAHDGIFNLESMYLETEEIFFVNSEFGGPFWDRDNPIAQRSYAASPHRFVQNWTAPLLVIHGGRDYRVPESQGFSAFNAARLRDIPARLLYLPDENHWVLSPQNSVLWYRTVLDWADQWTGGGAITANP